MSSMFGGGFKGSKCKTLLRLAMARIKLLRNKRDIQIKQMRKDIAQLLSTDQEPSARIRVEHIAREQNIMAAYDIIELFCELIIVRLPIIESQKACPMDLKESVCSLVFASQRCADLPELLQVRSLFSSKYGKEFVAAATELRPECGVNRRIIEKLSVRAPSGPTKLKLLTEIAAEHNVSWDPANTEAELMKQPEDLLDGPKAFFGPSQAPVIEFQPLLPQEDEAKSQAQRAPAVPSQASPLVPTAPSVTQQSSGQIPPSHSYEDTSSDEEKQFIPFAGPPPAKAAPAERFGLPPKGKASRSGPKGVGSVSSSTEDPYARGRNESQMGYSRSGNYDDVAAAAKAAAESANRAVAAARAAAELAKMHPSERDTLPKQASQDLESSSSEEDDEVRKPTLNTNSESGRQEKVNNFVKTNDPQKREEKSHAYYTRSGSGDRQEASFRRSNSDDKQEGLFRRSNEAEEESFSRGNFSDDRPEKNLNSVARFDGEGEEETFWKREDQDSQHDVFSKPEKEFDSGGFFSSRGNEQESLYRRDTNLFNRSEREDPPPSRSKGSGPYTGAPKTFSSSNSASDLFKRSNSEERELRSAENTPFSGSEQGFATPKFDDEEPAFGKRSSHTTDFSFRRDLDNQMSNVQSPRSKPSFDEFWRTSSMSHRGEEESGGILRSLNSAGSDEYGIERPKSGSQSMFDMDLSEPAGGSTDSLSRRASYESNSPKATKSRRTHSGVKGQEKLDRSGGSGGLPPPPGRRPKSSSGGNIESSRSPEYGSPTEVDNSLPRSSDDSSSYVPKTSLSFYKSPSKAYAPPERTPPPTSSASLSPDRSGDSWPPVTASPQTSRSSPGLERQDAVSSPPLHPKLPDYDDLTARFEALKGKGKTRR